MATMYLLLMLSTVVYNNDVSKLVTSIGPAHCVPPPFNIPRSSPVYTITSIAQEEEE